MLYTGQDTYEGIEGQDFNIALTLEGNPFPPESSLVWSFDGQPLSAGGGMEFGLDFLRLFRSSEGTYTVSSSNSVGTATFEFQLLVSCKYVAIAAATVGMVTELMSEGISLRKVIPEEAANVQSRVICFFQGVLPLSE